MVKKTDSGKVINTRECFLAIDPSINNMGIAVYEHEKLRHYELLRPNQEVRDEGIFIKKCLSMVNEINILIDKYDVQHLVLEVPEHWAVAGFNARESGSMTKLMFLCGGIFTHFNMITVPVHTLHPREWKGQLPKDVVRKRLKKHMVPKYFTVTEWMKLDHNIMDAVVIGQFWILGRI